MKPLIIFGIGDIAQLATYYFETDSDRRIEAFTVDREFIQEGFEGRAVVPFDEVKLKFPPASFDLFIALSYRNLNKVRESKFIAAKEMGYNLPSYISSHCSYVSQFKPGENCFILEDNTIQPFVKIGDNVTLWSGNHIGHHTEIKNHNFISSHVVVSGHCVIDSNCFIGVNATLHNNVHVKPENLIGAGAIITKSTNEGDVYVPQKSTLLDKKSNQINF